LIIERAPTTIGKSANQPRTSVRRQQDGQRRCRLSDGVCESLRLLGNVGFDGVGRATRNRRRNHSLRKWRLGPRTRVSWCLLEDRRLVTDDYQAGDRPVVNAEVVRHDQLIGGASWSCRTPRLRQPAVVHRSSSVDAHPCRVRDAHWQAFYQNLNPLRRYSGGFMA